MPSIKFNFFFWMLLTFTNLIFNLKTYGFSLRECLDANFQASVQSKTMMGKILKNEILIKKQSCILDIEFKKFNFNFFSKNYSIDVCRLPIHIKKGDASSTNIFRREKLCYEDDDKDEFCKQYSQIMTYILEYGLILAEGEKDLITTPHGHFFCAYKLLRYYLLEGKIFNRNNTENIFESIDDLGHVRPRPIFAGDLKNTLAIPDEGKVDPTTITPPAIPATPATLDNQKDN